MNLESSTDALAREYRVSHGSGSYLCSYEGCPRASQGFSSLELRQQHEESHEPRFQCSNPACGFWKCSSEAALRKHNAKYHNGRDVSCVPDYLNSSLSGAPQERSLFRLATPRKRSPMQDSPTNEPLVNTESPNAYMPGGNLTALLPPLEATNRGIRKKLRKFRDINRTPQQRATFQERISQAAQVETYSSATKDAEQDMLYSHREQIEDQDIGRDRQVSQVAKDFKDFSAFEIPRQSYPTLQTTTNALEDKRLYNWGDLALPDLPSSPHAGGVTDYRSLAFPSIRSENSEPLLWTEYDTSTVVPGSVDSLPSLSHEFDEHCNWIGE